jgi:hypothetical protein
MKIYNQIIEAYKDKKGEILTSKQIKNMLKLKFNTNSSSIIPSDYCYNRTNKGVNFNQHLFIRINRKEYKYLGENYPYIGRIYWKPKQETNELFVGEWEDGKYTFFQNVFKEQKDNINNSNIKILTISQIKKLYEEYIKILELEINIFNLRPTEVRHLIGRIGEFKCAIVTNGTLSHEVNQHGFDVISNNKKISVKTTAQKNGFISINKNTIKLVDELMIFQFINNEFKIIYYGDINQAIEKARTFNNKYELDISKAKRLISRNI